MDARTILLEEHRAIGKVLDALADIVTSRVDIPYAKLDHIHGAVRFLDRYLNGFHMQREENILYPALAEHDLGGPEGPLAIMTLKRDMIRGFVRHMNDTLRDIASGSPSTHDLRASAHALIEFVRARILLEEAVLIPAIALLMNEDARRRLHAALQGEDGVRGAEQHDEMIEEADRITERLTGNVPAAVTGGARW